MSSIDMLRGRLFRAVVECNSEEALSVARELVEVHGFDVKTMLTEVLVPAMRKVGELYEREEYFIADLIACAEAFKAVVDNVVKPRLKGEDRIPVKAVAVFGTVKGDIHSLGKDIAKTIFEAEGFEVIDLGEDVPAEVFVEKALEYGARIIGASALMTATMIEQRRIIEELKRRGVRDRFIVIVGGAPVTDEWVREIGADVNGSDVFRALKEVKRLLGAE